jgi:hypothetical protein
MRRLVAVLKKLPIKDNLPAGVIVGIKLEDDRLAGLYPYPIRGPAVM